MALLFAVLPLDPAATPLDDVLPDDLLVCDNCGAETLAADIAGTGYCERLTVVGPCGSTWFEGLESFVIDEHLADLEAWIS